MLFWTRNIKTRQDFLSFDHCNPREWLGWNRNVYIWEDLFNLLESSNNHPRFGIHDIMMTFYIRNFKVPASKFRKMSSSEGGFGAKHGRRHENFFETCGHGHLFVELGRLCQVRLAVKIINFKNFRPAF